MNKAIPLIRHKLSFSQDKLNMRKLQLFKIRTREKLIAKHISDDTTYNKKVINDIIYNDKSRIVAAFKDFLIYDDLSEFLKRFYSLSESYTRLPKFFNYYEKCSRIFPNYISLHEAKYIYKNIQRKQKMIDLQQQIDQEHKGQKKEEQVALEDDHIFSTEVYNSIMDQTSGKDDLQNIFQSTISNQEASVTNLEKLINSIIEAEQIAERKKIPISHREKDLTQVIKIVSPVKKSNKDFHRPLNNETSSKQKNDNKNMNTIDIGGNYYNKNAEGILKNYAKDKMEAFETNILSQRFEDIHKKTRVSSETISVTAVRENLNEIKITGRVPINWTSSNFYRERRPSQNKNKEKNPESESENPHVMVPSHKNTLSMPKLTNIFYIINQNPQVNTHITIYNNNQDFPSPKIAEEAELCGGLDEGRGTETAVPVKLKVNKNKENSRYQLSTAREQVMTKSKSKLHFPSNDKNTFNIEKQKKNMNTIGSPNTNGPVILNLINPSLRSTFTLTFGEKYNHKLLKEDELRTSAPSFHLKQATGATSSRKESKLATIQYDEVKKNNNIFDGSPLYFNGHKQKEKVIPLMVKNEILKSTAGRSKKYFNSKVPYAGKLNVEVLSSMISQKEPISPKEKLAEYGGHNIFMNGSKQISNMNNQRTEVIVPQVKNSKEVVSLNPSKAVKGFQISNFKEVYKQESNTPYCKSERLQVKNCRFISQKNKL